MRVVAERGTGGNVIQHAIAMSGIAPAAPRDSPMQAAKRPMRRGLPGPTFAARSTSPKGGE